MVDALPYRHRAACSGAALKRNACGLSETKAAGDPQLGMQQSRNLAVTRLKRVRAAEHAKWIMVNPQSALEVMSEGLLDVLNSMIVLNKALIPKIIAKILSTGAR
jgi:hypothetical protein